MGLSSHQSAAARTVDWLTPPDILERLGEFDLDPCCPVGMPWATAKHHYTVEDDGFTKRWFGRVWMTPPFGAEAAYWMHKMALHGNGIALIPARTETRMFFNHVWDDADSVLFVKGRPHFHYPNGQRAPFNSGAPICLVAYGADNSYVLRNSGLGKWVGL